MQSASIVCALFLFAASLVSCANLFEEDYLPVYEVRPDSTFSKDLLEYMNENKLESPDAKTKEQDLQAYATGARDPAARDFYEELANLALNEPKVTYNTLRYVYGILALAKASPEVQPVQNYIEYLRTVGRRAFERYARSTVERFKAIEGRIEPDVEQGLDELVEAYSSKIKIREGTADFDLLMAARKVELVSGDYNVRKMLKVAKEHLSSSPLEDEKNKSVKLLGGFISSWCAKLQSQIGDVLGAYNLARTFIAEGISAPEVDLPNRIAKLNEYNRVCLSWQKNRQRAEENLKRQMDATKWYKIPRAGN